MSIEIKSGGISLTCTTKEDVVAVLGALGVKAAIKAEQPSSVQQNNKKGKKKNAGGTGQHTWGYKIAKTGPWTKQEGQIIFDIVKMGGTANDAANHTVLTENHSPKAAALMFYLVKKQDYKKMGTEFGEHIKSLYSLKTNLLTLA